MGIIKVLDEHIANQIAAGEVVERPSSVVKELVENSIDAGSTMVDVTIEEGGLKLIRIRDNGCGMGADDCETAFYRHATSKISQGRDLFHIRTLGFRGEALPSIAAVAKVEIITSARDDGLGRKLVVEDGKMLHTSDAASPRGTDITVKDLFYNTPARLKYMKTLQTELGHISDYMYRLAFANPHIGFSLKHNGNMLLKTQGNGDLLQVIAAVYGTSTAKAMLAFKGENLDYAIQGYISRPELTRSNRTAISAIVNGRYIRNYAISTALLKAYHTLLPINRFPLAVLHIEMDPSLVDVNVHPSKLEVRFSKEQELNQFIEAEARRALGRQVLIPGISAKSAPKPAKVLEQVQWYGGEIAATNESSETIAPDNENTRMTESSSEFNTDIGHRDKGRPESEQSLSPKTSVSHHLKEKAAQSEPVIMGKETPAPVSRPTQAERSPQNSGYRADRSSLADTYRPARTEMQQMTEWLTAASADQPANSVPAFPQLSPIGQAHGTYIIAQNETGLYLIDQHAAHERINYEYYYEKFGQPGQASQQLLVPITLEFTPSEAAQIQNQLPLFEQAGVHLEHFGGQTFLVRSYPHWFPQGDERAIIEEMAEWILNERKSIDLSKLREKSAILCSCKASIKANQSLTITEMEALLNRLGNCRNPYTCPHGRPIVVSFSTYELEKMFKRVM